jgi:hypothetical protein
VINNKPDRKSSHPPYNLHFKEKKRKPTQISTHLYETVEYIRRQSRAASKQAGWGKQEENPQHPKPALRPGPSPWHMIQQVQNETTSRHKKKRAFRFLPSFLQPTPSNRLASAALQGLLLLSI